MCNLNGNEILKFVEHNELASINEEEPTWKENLFTEHGKWMDGWETRRKRQPGHDWTIIALGQRSLIEGFCVDTAYFTGNYAPRFSIQAVELTERDQKRFPPRYSKMGSSASEKSLIDMAVLKTENWETLVPMSDLKPGYPESRKMYVTINSTRSWTHLRLNIYPDGGIARLRVYGIVSPDWDRATLVSPIDLVSMKNGGICEAYSNAHYGHPRNLIKAGTPVNMADGWETARRLDRPPVIRINDSGIIQVTGEEWVIFRLARIGSVESVIVETTHFKGNFPDRVKIEGILKSGKRRCVSVEKWITLLPSTKLAPNKIHVYNGKDLVCRGPFSHVKIIIAPDGGFSRFRVFGHVQKSI